MIYKQNSIVLESVSVQNNCVENLMKGTRIYNLKGTSDDVIKVTMSDGSVRNFTKVIGAYKEILKSEYNNFYFEIYQDLPNIDFEYDSLEELENNNKFVDSISQKCCNENCKHRGSKICGAHVDLLPPVRDIQIGDKFYIVPLCDSCNQEYYEPIILAYDVPAIVGIWDGIRR